MADKTINELSSATSVTSNDLFVLQQAGAAKKLTAQVLENWLVNMADGHGGIQSIAKISTSGLTDTYRITLADQTTSTFTVTNGKSIQSIGKTSTSGLVDTYTISFNNGSPVTYTVTNGKGIQSIGKTSTSGLTDYYTITYTNGTSQTYQVKNGAKGDTGAQTYVHIKWASQEPTATSHTMSDTPDKWIGIYAGTSATAPAYTEYKWYEYKGAKGNTGTAASLQSSVVEYQVSDSGIATPGGVWGTAVPIVPAGKFLWTRVTITFNTGNPIVFYSVAKYGIDGSGAVSSVNSQEPDAGGNVLLTAENVYLSDGSSTTIKTELDGKLSNANGAVTTAKLADNGITTAKVADGAITTAKLASTANAPSATKLQTARAIGNASFNGTAGITLSQMGAMGERSSMQWNTAQGATLGWYTIGTISNINSAVIDVWSTSYSEGKGQLIINYSYAEDGNTKTPSMVYMGSNLSLCIDAFRLTDNATGTYNGVQTLEAHLSNNGNTHQMRFKSLYIDSGFSFVNTPALVTAARRTTAEVSTQEVLNISGKINPEAITSNIELIDVDKEFGFWAVGKFMRCINEGEIFLYLPCHNYVELPIGTEMELFREGGGEVIIEADSNVLLLYPDNFPADYGATVSIGSPHGVVALKQIEEDVWVISGDLG